jgi:hypothetical protein
MNLIEQKALIAKIELKEWLEKPDCMIDNYQSNIDDIVSYLEGEGNSKTILRRFKDLHYWYSANFMYNSLNEMTVNGYEVSANGFHIMAIADVHAQKFPNASLGLSFETIVLFFANCVIQRWHKQAKWLLTKINRDLNSSLDGGDEFYTSSWFLLQVSNKAYGLTIDYLDYNYPKSLHIYKKAIDNWDSKDLIFLDTIVSEMCEYHVKQANYGGENSLFEFENYTEFVYAYEILTWLILREYVGIPNPTNFSHPLMTLPHNQLLMVATELKENELFLGVMHRLKEEYKL